MRDFFADTVLRPAGFEVLTASDGRAGFRLAQEQHPHLIIADLQMPGLNGLELKAALVAAGNHCPLILVTAEGSENPQGPSEGEARVIRGGGWNGAQPSWVRPTFRYRDVPAKRAYAIGFRCAKSL